VNGFLKRGQFDAVRQGIKRLDQFLVENPQLAEQYEPRWMSIADTLRACLRRPEPKDISKLLSITKPLLLLLSQDSSPDLIQRADQIERLPKSLLQLEKQCLKSVPSTQELKNTVQQYSQRAGIDVNEVIEYLYLNPHRLPFLAAAFDAKRYRQAQWIVTAVEAERAASQDDDELSARKYREILNDTAAHARAAEGLAQFAFKRGKKQQSIELLRSAIASGNASPSAYNSLSWQLSTAGNPTPADLLEAQRHIRRGLELSPLPALWDTLAEVLFRQQDLRGAIVACREALQLDPEKEFYQQRMQTLWGAFPFCGPVFPAFYRAKLRLVRRVQICSSCSRGSIARWCGRLSFSVGATLSGVRPSARSGPGHGFAASIPLLLPASKLSSPSA